MTKHIHPIKHILQYFTYGHLPPHLKAVSSLYSDLAYQMADVLPDSPETVVALRKLLESKDAAVRAALVTKEQS